MTRTTVAFAIVGALAAGVFTEAGSALAAPTNPPTNPGTVAPSNPSDQQLQGAAAQKAALDQQVGQLSGQIADAQARLQELQTAEENAEQDVAYTVSKYRDAVERYDAAKRALTGAVRAKAAEQARFAQYMQASYADGDIGGMTGNLLTATDPSALLRKSDYEQYEVERSAGAIGRMELVSVQLSNARAASTRAKAAAATAKRKAAEAQQRAEDAVADQQSQEAGLQNTMNQRQVELVAARKRQSQLTNDRATFDQYQRQLTAYNDYVAEQRRIAEEKRRIAVEKARLAAAAKAARIRAEKAAARERAEEKAAKAKAEREGKKYVPKKKKKKRSTSSSSGSSSNDSSPAPSSNGGWTAAKGKRAVKRARKYLGLMYAWAGGNTRGPTYGVCTAGDAANDCYIKGFDCSGLVLYAWGKNWDHLAHNQYVQAGSKHPSRSKLKAGDLLFFGGRGNGRRLHHVAIYVGHGDMIEAPQSGSRIRISSIYRYSDYYGATRPLT